MHEGYELRASGRPHQHRRDVAAAMAAAEAEQRRRGERGSRADDQDFISGRSQAAGDAMQAGCSGHWRQKQAPGMHVSRPDRQRQGFQLIIAARQ